MPHKKPLSNQPLSAPQAPCPCGSLQSLATCCLPFVSGTSAAPTAEALMRSRYSAHVLLAIDYLWDTWSPQQRARSSKAAIRQWAASCEWLGLQIIATQQGSAEDATGIVEFVALFRQAGELHQHHEVSLFEQASGKWFYIDHQPEQV